MIFLKASQEKSKCEHIKNIKVGVAWLLNIQHFMLAPAVVQLHPCHREERERAAYSGGAAALRRGQSGASGGHRSPQPGHGQKEQGLDR